MSEWGAAFADSAKSSSGQSEWGKAFAAAPPASGQSEWGQAFEGVKHAAGEAGSAVGRVLDAQRWGLAKLVTGESDTNNQRTAERKAVGLEGAYQGLGQVPVVGHALQGASDFVQDTVLDPLTYESLGSNVLRRGAAKVGAAASPLVGAAAAKIPQSVKKMADTAHDFFTFGGEAKRAYGVPKVQQMLGAEARIEENRARLERKLNAQVETALKGLTPDETARVFNARQNFLSPAALTPKEQTALNLLTGWQQRMFRLSKAAERMALPGELPPVTQLPGWLPLPVTPGAKALGMPAETFNKLEGFDRHLLQRRGASRALSAADVPDTLEAIKSANRSKGSLLAGKALSQDVRKAVPALSRVWSSQMPNDIRKLFEVKRPATGAHMTGEDIAKKIWKTAVSAPKTAVVGVTPGHIANMASPLGGMAAAQPGGYRAIGAAVKNFPKNYRDVVTEGEKTTPLIEGALKHPLTRPLGKYMSAVNHATWAVDKGLMDEFARQFTAKGMHPDQARQVARETMVDYEHLSPFAQKMKAIMPFGTWNTGLWKQIVNGVVKDPFRAAAINRATGGYFYGNDVPAGDTKYRSLLPAAEVGRAIGDLHEAAKFARKSLAIPVDVGFALAEKAARPGTKYPFATYGLDPTEIKPKPGEKVPDMAKLIINMVTMGVPEASTVEGALGVGPLKPDSIGSEVMRQTLRALPLQK
jgi:hypothetical protein